MNKIIIITIFCFFSSFATKAQDGWSLERCISHAWENNLQVKQQELNVERSKNTLLTSKLAFAPRISGSVNHNMNWGRSVNINDLEIIENALSQTTSASLSASLPLIQGLSRVNQQKADEISLEMSLQDVEYIKNEISLTITQSFLQVLLSMQILGSTEENLKSITAQKERTEVLVNAGEQPYSSLLDIEAQLASERVQLISATNQVKSNKLSLMQLLDLPYSDDFNIVSPNEAEIIKSQEWNIDDLYVSSSSLPQIQTAKLSLEKSKYELAIAKGMQYPSLSMNAGYGSYYSDRDNTDFFEQFLQNKNPSIGFSLSIPIFNGLRNKTNVDNARIGLKNSQIELDKARQDLYKKLQTAINDASSSFERYIASELNLKAIKESFRYVEEKFNVGVLNGTDYNVAKTNLFKAQSDYYQAKYQYIFQTKILDFYRGIPISL